MPENLMSQPVTSSIQQTLYQQLIVLLSTLFPEKAFLSQLCHYLVIFCTVIYIWTFLLLDERGLRQVRCSATSMLKLLCCLCCAVPKGGTTISPTTYLLLTCLSSCKTVLLKKCSLSGHLWKFM